MIIHPVQKESSRGEGGPLRPGARDRCPPPLRAPLHLSPPLSSNPSQSSALGAGLCGPHQPGGSLSSSPCVPSTEGPCVPAAWAGLGAAGAGGEDFHSVRMLITHRRGGGRGTVGP